MNATSRGRRGFTLIELMAKWDWASRGDNLNVTQEGNPDLMRVQKAAWGELGYTPQSGS